MIAVRRSIARSVVAIALGLALIATSAYARGGGHGGGGGHSGYSRATGGGVSVRGYYRSNGTYVAPYTRRAPGTASPYSPGSNSTSPSYTRSHDNSWDDAPPGIRKHASHHISGVDGDSHRRIGRSLSAKNDFKREHPCPWTGGTSGACPGYVIDHVIPLKRGGPDAPVNMQWQTIDSAKAKDKWE